MNIHHSDPREQKQGWVSDPIREYHVELWYAPPSGNLWRYAEYRLTEAKDMHEALAWAEAESAEHGATYALYAVVGEGDTEGLVSIAGVNPTSSRGNFERRTRRTGRRTSPWAALGKFSTLRLPRDSHALDRARARPLWALA